MTTKESEMEVLKSILNDFANQYQGQINEINSLVNYKKWAFTGDYQKIITIDELRVLIEKYALNTVDPRTIQDFIDQYNEKEWFKYFPMYNKLGKLQWVNVSEITTIVNSFLKTGKQNTVQNFVDYLNNNQTYLYKICAALVWNKLDYTARISNTYMFKPNLFDNVYEDGNTIGTLARNNQEESPLVICLGEFVSLIKGFIQGTTDSSSLFVTNSSTIRAGCSYQLNQLNLKNISTIEDFWKSGIGKKFKEPFENLTDQKKIEKINNEKKQMETSIIEAMKMANFANANISLCNMNQNISGAILALDSASISLSQECVQTTTETITISQKLENLTQELALLKSETIEDHSKRIGELEKEITRLRESSWPKIIIDYRNKFDVFVEKLNDKYGPKVVISVSVVITVICIVLIFLINFFIIRSVSKDVKKSTKINSEI